MFYDYRRYITYALLLGSLILTVAFLFHVIRAEKLRQARLARARTNLVAQQLGYLEAQSPAARSTQQAPPSVYPCNPSVAVPESPRVVIVRHVIKSDE